jgi:hypothetical protein
MGAWISVRRAGRFLQKIRLSLGPDSYFRYKRDRDYERKQARTDAENSARHAEVMHRDAEQAVERRRRHDERYVRERAERTEASDSG